MSVVAIVGASRDRRKFGNKALRAFRQQGHTVVPIHPSAADIEGERAYRSVLDYPGAIDEASLYVPPAVGVRVLDEIAAKRIPFVWINPGADDGAVVERARALGLHAVVACSILASASSQAITRADCIWAEPRLCAWCRVHEKRGSPGGEPLCVWVPDGNGFPSGVDD